MTGSIRPDTRPELHDCSQPFVPQYGWRWEGSPASPAMHIRAAYRCHRRLDQNRSRLQFLRQRETAFFQCFSNTHEKHDFAHRLRHVNASVHPVRLCR